MIRQSDVPIRLSEFGTRRRYSRDWQTVVIDTLAAELPEALQGTSNVYDARRLGIAPVGTMGHEFLQAFQVFAPLPQSQRMALSGWLEEFRGALGIALSDVISREAFLADFDLLFAKAYDGARQDSGDPLDWGDRLIDHYRALGIDPMTKLAVFTDSLTIVRAQEIARYFAGRIRTSFGIGTHLTNDFDFEAPQIVIKMVRCDGWPVAKLSDSPGKLAGFSREQCIQRPGAHPCRDQEQNAHQHGKIRPRIAHHEPETLPGSGQLRRLGRDNGGQNDDQQGDAGQAPEQTGKHEKPTGYLKCASEVGSELRMRKADFREAEHAHFRVGKFQYALSEEDKAHRYSDEYDGRRCG
jgi:nicotinic acid phosphoribosyltransferase